MTIKIETQNWAYLFGDLSDKERLDMIKTLILCHPNGQEFRDSVLKTVEKMEID